MPTKKDQEYFDRSLEISKVGTWYSAKAMIKWYEAITVIRTHKERRDDSWKMQCKIDQVQYFQRNNVNLL